MKKIFIVTLMLISYVTILAQGVGINNDGSVPHPSAILDIKSNTRGLLIPRTSTSSRIGISNPANGLMLYDTTIGSFWFQNSGVWIESGRLDASKNNAFFGYRSGNSLPLGNFNSGFGTEALYSNTNGAGNSAIGLGSLRSNTNGNYNTAAGRFALYFNTTGSNNTAIGNSALLSNQTGFSNVAIGAGALFHNTTGSYDVAIGDSALFNSDNSQINTAVGTGALYASTSGYGNTAVGASALVSNTTGFENTAVGVTALYLSTNSFDNVAIGYSAFFAGNGSDNVAIGYDALNGGNGNSNVAVGSETSVLGSFNTAIGKAAWVQGEFQYSSAIGANSKVNCGNCLALGGPDATSRTKVGINIAAPFTDLHIIQESDGSLDKTRGIRIQRANGNQWRTLIDPSNNYIFEYNNNLYSYIEPVGGAFVNPSDERLKTDIAPIPGVLAKLLLLQPKTYQYIATSDAGRLSYGFLAQDVEKLFPDFVFSSENGIKGIAYSNFSVIAIKAIQEQQQSIQDQKQLIDVQKQKIDHLEQQMEEVLKELSELRSKKIEQ